ncbi:MAG: chorismate-binding protein [Thermoflexibacteraceae bacterium]
MKHAPLTVLDTSVPFTFPYQAMLLDSLLHTAFALALPVAVWRLPVQKGGSVRHIAIGATQHLQEKAVQDLENLPKGFLLNPFESQTHNYFLPAHFYYNSEKQELSISDTVETALVEKFLHTLQTAIIQQSKPNTYYTTAAGKTTLSQFTDDTQRQEHYEDIVTKAVRVMQSGDFQKVVLSRTQPQELPLDFSLAHTFENLCHLYPHAFVSCVATHEFGTWVGASPEVLIATDNSHKFHTIALAGTQPKGDITNLQEAMWRQKEIEEQALVSRYIINCFKKIRLREYEEMGPKTVVAGNLLHLRTDFEVDMVATNFMNLGSTMLGLLHPTSAVCGMPKPESLQFILDNEGYDRQLYAGYLGQVNVDGASNLFVNLRCMQLLRTHALLYAGAGITKDSVPHREWQETVHKSKTIGKIFNAI